jgi:DNA mismatch repair protein MutL
VQGLLEPGTLELTPRQAAVLGGVLPTLAELGFEMEPFGERSYLVRAVPAHLAKGWDAAVKELLEELGGEEKSRWEEKTVASLACHNAIRSGQALSMEEMAALVRQLEETANPHTCPHGRPTIVKLERDYLERHFGRYG